MYLFEMSEPPNSNKPMEIWSFIVPPIASSPVVIWPGEISTGMSQIQCDGGIIQNTGWL